MVDVAKKQIINVDSPLPIVGSLSKEQRTLYSILNEDPDQSKLLKNKFAQNAVYLPISHIEALMDSTFGPTNWKVSEPKLSMMGASAQKAGQAYMSCTLVVSVINTQFDSPVWIERGGASSGSVTHGTINTAAAKLKAEAFKNACKSLGKVFGRDLNRNHQETITTGIRTEDEQETILEIDNLAQLETYFKTLSKSDQRTFAGIYTTRKNELMKGGKDGK